MVLCLHSFNDSLIPIHIRKYGLVHSTAWTASNEIISMVSEVMMRLDNFLNTLEVSGTWHPPVACNVAPITLEMEIVCIILYHKVSHELSSVRHKGDIQLVLNYFAPFREYSTAKLRALLGGVAIKILSSHKIPVSQHPSPILPWSQEYRRRGSKHFAPASQGALLLESRTKHRGIWHQRGNCCIWCSEHAAGRRLSAGAREREPRGAELGAWVIFSL